ncbi:hypothetical protein EDB87DRAFT_1661388, partial [Lactarius vividus]
NVVTAIDKGLTYLLRSNNQDLPSAKRLSPSQRLLIWGVELCDRVHATGIHPVAIKDRKEMQLNKIFFVRLSVNTNILSFSSGTLGPVAFGLGLRDSCLVILFFHLLFALASGLKLGLRQLCSTRYTFGDLAADQTEIRFIGFAVLNSMVDGQALARVGNVSWTVEIIVVSVISLFLSGRGHHIFRIYLILLTSRYPSVNSKLLAAHPVTNFERTWLANYGKREELVPLSTPSHRPLISKVALQCLDATAAITVPVVPSQEAEYTGGNVGGLIDAMLQPVGKFGKVLMVFVSLSVTGNNVPTIYSFGMCFQTFVPSLVVVPRYVFSMVVTAV